MELYLAEKLKKYRKERDLTQEELARVIGVSPQSVSKWECGDGYPDITLLPGISNFFEVSIDELLGNDRISMQEDMHNYYDEWKSCLHTDKGFLLTVTYYRKYPKDFHIMSALASEIVYGAEEKRKARMPLLREVCGRILSECTDTVIRRSAVKYMCMVCTEEEVQNWLRRDTECWYEDMNFILEERYAWQKDTEKQRMYHGLNNLLLISRLLEHHGNYTGYCTDPAESAAMSRSQLELILYCNGGVLADGWICEYMTHAMRLSAALMALGETEEGFRVLEECLVLRERWLSLAEEEPLDMGSLALFGGVRGIRERCLYQFPDGRKGVLHPALVYSCCDIYSILIAPAGWEWFDSVREDPRFHAAVEKAKTLCTEKS